MVLPSTTALRISATVPVTVVVSAGFLLHGGFCDLDAVIDKQLLIVLLALGHRGAGGGDLVVRHIDHGVHLHQIRRILQGHEVGGLVGDIQQDREGGGIVQMLHRALGRGHGGILGSTGDVVITGILGALVDQNKAHVGLVPAGGGNAGIKIHVVVQGDIVYSPRWWW